MFIFSITFFLIKIILGSTKWLIKFSLLLFIYLFS